jgi:alpha-galactosidase
MISLLTLPEIQSLATAIALTGGSLLVSDDMAQLPSERLRILAALLPVMNQRPVVMDKFDSQRPSKLRLDLKSTVGQWLLLAYFNWQDRDIKTQFGLDDFGVDKGKYHIRSFWDEQIWQAEEGDAVFSGKISSHGVVLLAVRKTEASFAAYLGSDLHISQGLEATSWKSQKKELHIEIRSGKKLAGKVDLWLKSNPKNVEVNGKPSPWEMLGHDIYRIMLPDENRSSITMEF